MNKIEYVTWAIVLALLSCVVPFYVGKGLWTGLLYLPLILLVEALGRSAWLTAWVNARGGVLEFVIFAVFATVGTVLIVTDFTAVAADEFLVRFTFCMLAVVLGFLLRGAVGALALQCLLSDQRLLPAILTSVFWSMCIMVTPQLAHRSALPGYVVGFAVGILIHRGLGLPFYKKIVAYRRLQLIADLLPPGQSLFPVELDALRLLAKGRLRRLNQHLVKYSDVESDVLPLVGMILFRLRGDYLKSNLELEKTCELTGCPICAAKLLLHIANLNDAGLTEEADERLSALLNSPVGRSCAASKMIYARQSAHEFLSDVDNAVPAPAPLYLVLEAMEQLANGRRKKGATPAMNSVEQLISPLVEVGVPVAAPLVVDTYGYCLLAAGHVAEARATLVRCIVLDPTYSAAYLHLGDYFLFRNRFGHGARRPTESDLWHASACFFTAIQLEPNEAGRVYVQAKKRLEKVVEMQDGRR